MTRIFSDEHRRRLSESHLGKSHSPELIEKIRQANMGKHHSEESRKKMSESKKGIKNLMHGKVGMKNPFFGKHHTVKSIEKMKIGASERNSGKNNPMYGIHLVPWNKGLKGVQTGWNRGLKGVYKTSEETKKKLSSLNSGEKNHFFDKQHSVESLKKMSTAAKKQMTPERRKEIGLQHKGQIVSPELRDRISKSLRVSEPHKRAAKDPAVRKKISDAKKEHWKRPEYIEANRRNMEKRWQDPTFVKKVMKALHSKTRPEIQLDTLLQQLYPGEFKYNGCFECGVLIDGLTPDFVNCNGQKKLIEMFGDYHHEESDIAERTERFAKYGFSALFIWASELKNEKKEVVQKIVDFVGKPPQDYWEAISKANPV